MILDCLPALLLHRITLHLLQHLLLRPLGQNLRLLIPLQMQLHHHLSSHSTPNATPPSSPPRAPRTPPQRDSSPQEQQTPKTPQPGPSQSRNQPPTVSPLHPSQERPLQQRTDDAFSPEHKITKSDRAAPRPSLWTLNCTGAPVEELDRGTFNSIVLRDIREHKQWKKRQEERHGVPMEEDEEDEEEKAKESELQQTEQPAESSSDPLGRWDEEAVGLCDALCTESLISLSEDIVQGDSFYSLEQAMEYAFNAKSLSNLPSEPNQWKDIRG